MPDRRFPVPFGQGLDRETGELVVRPGSFDDIRNFLLHQGKMLVRPGFSSTVDLEDDEGNPVSHVVKGRSLRTERIGIVVSYQETTEKVWVHRVEADGTLAQLLGEWVNDNGWGDTPPRVKMAESYGRVFMAHDTRLVGDRAPTIYYDPIFGSGALTQLTGDFEGLGSHPIRYRGVRRHLKYLFGWGYGDESEDRPELVRNSVPGDPTIFRPNHYFIAGDRRDPVLDCKPAGRVLLPLKESEGHVIFGSGRDDFGIDILDPLYGLLDSQLAVNFGGYVIAWSDEGPRVWDGQGPSEEIAIPLDLGGPDPASLVAEGPSSEAFAHYLPGLRIAAFVFGRRVYALTGRVVGDWKWSYWELGFDPLCAFTLFSGSVASAAPTGYPVYVPPEGLDTGPPAVLEEALGAWRVQDIDTDQTRVLLDAAGNGAHLYFGPPAEKDAVLGRGPFRIGKRGVVGTDATDRGLGIPNTGQLLNVGGSSQRFRATINFSCALDDGVQALVDHGASAAARSWWVHVGAGGVVTAGMSEDGTVLSDHTTVATLGGTAGFSDWDDMWLRVTFDIVADTVLVEYSADGVAWTNLEAAGNVTAVASVFQPAAADPVELGGRLLGTSSKLKGGGVYNVELEEDFGSGYVAAWEWIGQTAFYTDLEEIGNQGAADATDPAPVGDPATHVRFDGVDDQARTYEKTGGGQTDLSDQFDLAPGEVLTIILYAAMDQVNAGGAGTFTPIAKKADELLASQGWMIYNDGATNGFELRVSDGTTQESSPTEALVDDDELAAIILEVDGPDGEQRIRQVASLPFSDAYSDQGTGTNAFGVIFGRGGTGGDPLGMDFHAAAIFKRELTVAEQVDVAAWMGADTSGEAPPPVPDSAPTAGMYAHYAADELVGFADTDPVTSWPDLSPNGRDLSPVSAPFFSTGEINGLPAVRFDGVDDAFGILAQPRPGSTAITIWAIYYYVSGISSLVSWRQGGSNLLETHMPFNDGNFYFDHGNIGGGGRISGAAPGGFAGAYHLMELYKPDASGGGAYIAVDGVTAVSGSFTDALDALGTAELRIMGNAGNFTSGRLAELIIYEAAQSLEDRDATRAYLANKYGISVP